ncbi:polymorphic toxin type 15 domain-containing protein [Cellvibrio sp. QJXJ]|uniref:polymorphic toxin type 15 domain-containing protein n=1 Tax=Cellvibrio sp. QJXJ TaxID=2964606 RepID=UPI0021C49572|nr:polymorphic toxin type 15 domain-containing protein [Cellvibrio sp. QJXJ]UUA71077.1 polymorphic toxin type 15 domain-containing protein [Cellvibrio sp. QJXJ]
MFQQKKKEKDVPCFKKNAKGTPAEYDRQLKGQQDGLNNMTAKEYLEGRKAYTGKRASTAAKREAYAEELAENYFKSGAAKSKSEAKSMADDKMKTLNALHNPDMIAGGKDIIADFGDGSVNQSIGAQWKSRVTELDKAAAEAIANGQGDYKMNVNMHRCP